MIQHTDPFLRGHADQEDRREQLCAETYKECPITGIVSWQETNGEWHAETKSGAVRWGETRADAEAQALDAMRVEREHSAKSSDGVLNVELARREGWAVEIEPDGWTLHRDAPGMDGVFLTFWVRQDWAREVKRLFAGRVSIEAVPTFTDVTIHAKQEG